jgi:hypothetical protein
LGLSAGEGTKLGNRFHYANGESREALAVG